MLTTGVDVADGSGSSHDGVADTFKFTNGNEKIVLNNDGSGNYDVKSLSAKDSLKDVSTTDNDILQLNFALAAGSNIIGAKNIGSGVTIENIEEIDIIGSGANRTVFDNTLKATGLKTLKISGDFVGFDFNGKVIKDLTKIDATGITSVKSGVTLDASGAKQSLTIDGPNFAATVKGGAGDDIITAQGSVDGGAGNDIIYYTGESTVNGDAGDDIIEAAANAAEGAVVINGGAGKDLITVNGEATVNGGADDDIITINGAADVSVIGGAGKDKIVFAEGYAGTGTIGDLTTEDTLHINAGVVNATITEAKYTGTNLKVDAGNLTLTAAATTTTIDISKAKIAEGVESITINGGTATTDIVGSDSADIINAVAATTSVTGGKGADVITVVDSTSTTTVNYAGSGDSATATAMLTAETGSGTISVSVPTSELDVIKGVTTAKTKIQLGGGNGAYTAISSEKDFVVDGKKAADYEKFATAKLDAFVFKTADNKTYLFYETEKGDTTAFGNGEVVELTLAGTAATKFKVSADGLVEFVA